MICKPHSQSHALTSLFNSPSSLRQADNLNATLTPQPITINKLTKARELTKLHQDNNSLQQEQAIKSTTINNKQTLNEKLRKAKFCCNNNKAKRIFCKQHLFNNQTQSIRNQMQNGTCASVAQSQSKQQQPRQVAQQLISLKQQTAQYQQKRQICYLCETPRAPYALIDQFSQVVCRSCVNYEGPDNIELAIRAAREQKTLLEAPSIMLQQSQQQPQQLTTVKPLAKNSLATTAASALTIPIPPASGELRASCFSPISPPPAHLVAENYIKLGATLSEPLNLSARTVTQIEPIKAPCSRPIVGELQATQELFEPLAQQTNNERLFACRDLARSVPTTQKSQLLPMLDDNKQLANSFAHRLHQLKLRRRQLFSAPPHINQHISSAQSSLSLEQQQQQNKLTTANNDEQQVCNKRHPTTNSNNPTPTTAQKRRPQQQQQHLVGTTPIALLSSNRQDLQIVETDQANIEKGENNKQLQTTKEQQQTKLTPEVASFNKLIASLANESIVPQTEQLQQQQHQQTALEQALNNGQNFAVECPLFKAKNAHSLRCARCGFVLDGTHFVQCPADGAHKFCFLCAKLSILQQAARFGKMLGAQLFCPSGAKCRLSTSGLPWTFLLTEVRYIFAGAAAQLLELQHWWLEQKQPKQQQQQQTQQTQLTNLNVSPKTTTTIPNDTNNNNNNNTDTNNNSSFTNK